jgi:hypothetical protein
MCDSAQTLISAFDLKISLSEANLLWRSSYTQQQTKLSNKEFIVHKELFLRKVKQIYSHVTDI